MSRPWWRSPIFLVVLLVLFFPVFPVVLLLLMWLFAPWRLRVKWCLTGLFAALVILAVIGAFAGTTSGTSSGADVVTPDRVIAVRCQQYESGTPEWAGCIFPR
ncbi:MAG: hypothetical protein ABR978_06235 [Dehalococcoidia bacterium]|jgi:hypothetical protein